MQTALMKSIEDNQADYPHQFKVALKQLSPQTGYLKLTQGETFVLRKEG